MMKQRFSTERETIDWIINHKCMKYYDKIHVNRKYNQNGYSGELDCNPMKYRENKPHLAVYIEVKKNLYKRQYNAALGQFTRAQKAFPEYEWRFLLVSHDGRVRRIRI